MATRSMPTVSCRSSARARAIFVPTPSVDDASSGRRYLSTSRANRPAKPPRPPTTSGRLVRSTAARISVTARSPASMSTPEAAYVNRSALTARLRPRSAPRSLALPAMLARASLWRRSRPAQCFFRPARHDRAAGLLPRPPRDGALLEQRQRLEDVLAQHAVLTERDRVGAGEAGGAQPVGRLLGGGDQVLLGDVAQRVGVDRRAHALDTEAVGDQLRPAGEVDPVEARPLDRR